jgi:hypothetical protein
MRLMRSSNRPASRSTFRSASMDCESRLSSHSYSSSISCGVSASMARSISSTVSKCIGLSIYFSRGNSGAGLAAGTVNRNPEPSCFLLPITTCCSVLDGSWDDLASASKTQYHAASKSTPGMAGRMSRPFGSPPKRKKLLRSVKSFDTLDLHAEIGKGGMGRVRVFRVRFL